MKTLRPIENKGKGHKKAPHKCRAKPIDKVNKIRKESI